MITRKVRILVFLLLLASTTTVVLLTSRYRTSLTWNATYLTAVQIRDRYQNEIHEEHSTEDVARLLRPSLPPPATRAGKYLSYQPTGNGWNNQRQALEIAVFLARFLNRTLIVHPMSPHDKVRKMKQGVIPGYMIYNQLDKEDLLPLSTFLDMEKLSQVVNFLEYTGAHRDFLSDFGNKTWTNVCHSVGFGFWVYRHPRDQEERTLLRNQEYHLKPIWRKKCPVEQDLYSSKKAVIIRYVEDLVYDENEMLYFEQGTLFGISVRFFDHSRALFAQQVITQGIDVSPSVKRVAQLVQAKLGGRYNAVHVRRTDHKDRELPARYWIEVLRNSSISMDLPLYVSTDEQEKEFFQEFEDEGFSIHFYSEFLHVFDFQGIPSVLTLDYIGIHEQIICQNAERFIASPLSSFSVYILRGRGDLVWKQGLMTQYSPALWIPNQIKQINK
jgi:hypothetical protein